MDRESVPWYKGVHRKTLTNNVKNKNAHGPELGA